MTSSPPSAGRMPVHRAAHQHRRRVRRAGLGTLGAMAADLALVVLGAVVLAVGVVLGAMLDDPVTGRVTPPATAPASVPVLPPDSDPPR